MGRIALYRDETRPLPRAEVLLEPHCLSLVMPGGEVRSLDLDGSATMTADAASHRRFVRMLIVESRGARLIAITPPDRGTIAPRAIRLPEAPTDAAVIENPAYDALADWLLGGGRLAGCSAADASRAARSPSSRGSRRSRRRRSRC